MDRLKMLLQIQDCQRGLTIKEGVRKMAAEGAAPPAVLSRLFRACSVQIACYKQCAAVTRPAGFSAAPLFALPPMSCFLAVLPSAGTIRAFFKGNGTNVVKIAPETAIKLTLNDALKRARPWFFFSRRLHALGLDNRRACAQLS
jgi:hypothetical protein